MFYIYDAGKPVASTHYPYASNYRTGLYMYTGHSTVGRWRKCTLQRHGQGNYWAVVDEQIVPATFRAYVLLLEKS